jgi:transposase
VLRAGAPWRNMRERYGPHTSAYNRFNRCRRAGLWDRLMDAMVQAHDGKVQTSDSSACACISMPPVWKKVEIVA